MKFHSRQNKCSVGWYRSSILTSGLLHFSVFTSCGCHKLTAVFLLAVQFVVMGCFRWQLSEGSVGISLWSALFSCGRSYHMKVMYFNVCALFCKVLHKVVPMESTWQCIKQLLFVFCFVCFYFYFPDLINISRFRILLFHVVSGFCSIQ